MTKKKLGIRKLIVCAFISIAIALGTTCYAENPIIQTKFTADPAPMVYQDTVFLYTGHDEDDATGFKMLNWLLYTSTDMVNWTDHGSVASLKDFKWVTTNNGAWAAQCIHRNGKFYLYCPMPGGVGIGVLVADSPYGPFKDPIDKPLIKNSNDDIDPSVFIDDDGQAYLYWGNPKVYYVKLNEDMISYSGEVIKEPTTPDNYQEGPWVWKRNGHYYMAYASTCCPEGIGYAMSDSPTGPWVHKGEIMDPDKRSSGNHPGIIDFKGSSYVFGFNYAINFSLTNKHRERRSVCVEQMTYNSDGIIPKLPWWSETGAPQVGTLNPFDRTEAETIAWESGIETEKTSKNHIYVTDIDNGDFIKIKGVNWGERGAGIFSASVTSASNGGEIELRVDSLKGRIIGSLPISNTDGWDNWTLESTAVNNASGVHDLFLVFKGNPGEKLFNFDYWKFEEKREKSELVAINATVDRYKIDIVTGMNTMPLKVSAIYSDGTQKDVSTSASVTANQAGIVRINKGIIEGISYGSVNLAVSYKGKTDALNVLVKNYKDEHTVNRILSDKTNVTLFIESKLNLTITAEFVDGHTADITGYATYKNSDPQIVEVSNGLVTAKSNGDATITVSHTDEFGNVSSIPVLVKVTNRNPYITSKAVEYNEQSGVRDEPCSDSEGGKNIGFIQNGAWIKYTNVDFGEGASSFHARVASGTNGGNIVIRLDSPDGKLVGSLTVPGTNGWQNWVTKDCPVSDASGIHDLYFRFTGEGAYLLNCNWWEFKAE